MNLIELSDEHLILANEALSSHDGIARKRAGIIIAASKNHRLEQVVLSTGYSERSITEAISCFKDEDPKSFLKIRPKPVRFMFNNWFISSYEGAAWEYYKGALSHGPIENNYAVLARIKQLFPVPEGISILEIGPGEGALSMMIRDEGYNIECLDVGDFEFLPTDIPIIIMDADTGVLEALKGKKYDLVVAVEVIEHLKYPWKFIEDVFELLNYSGRFLLTTPNITGILSRARFLVFGEFYLFPKPKADLNYHGHIMPLHWMFIEHMFYCTGFVEIRTLSIIKTSIICVESLKSILFSFIRLICTLLAIKGPRLRSIMIEGKKPEKSCDRRLSESSDTL